MIKKKMGAWLLLAMIFMAGNLMAHESKKEDAEVLLKKAMDKMSAYKNFKANLSYTMDNKDMNIHEKKSGTIFVEGDKYRIDMGAQVIISDGKDVWTVLRDSKEVMLTSVDPNDPSSISPTNILSKYADYKAKIDHEDAAKDLVTLELNTKKDANYKKVTITLNTKTFELQSFSLYDDQGSVYTYHIVNLKSNLTFPAGTFTYRAKDFPGFGEPEDMR
ncbi:MAG: outer membrane lipoprotein carrier protein LolA [Bacteroidales bacterium]|nr:outer membrane lipoprotein carrier protein LolA [Bacteroidales bacterium]